MPDFLTYSEHRPPEELACWVAAYWHIKGVVPEGTTVRHRVLPDGCADLLVDCYAARSSGNSPGIIVGPMLAAQEFELRGPIDIVGIRFRPGGASSYFRLPLHGIRDDSVLVSDLPADRRLEVSQLVQVADPSSRFSILSASLRSGLNNIKVTDWVAEAVLAKFENQQVSNPLTISAMVRSIGLSERAVERRFLASVGMTLVQYRRLLRFRSTLRAYAGGCDNWCAIAHSTGYSDQPHLVREFRTWSGLTPAAWAESQAGDAGFIQDARVAIS